MCVTSDQHEWKVGLDAVIPSFGSWEEEEISGIIWAGSCSFFCISFHLGWLLIINKQKEIETEIEKEGQRKRGTETERESFIQ